MRKQVVAVIGASSPTEPENRLARRAGELLARAGVAVLTGGLGGVMRAASEGARSAGGTVLGILPSADPDDCNAHVDYAIATGIGDARNAVIANTADGFIAIGGGLGTLSEIAFALKRRKPVIALSTWRVDESRLGDERWLQSGDAAEAVSMVLRELGR